MDQVVFRTDEPSRFPQDFDCVYYATGIKPGIYSLPFSHHCGRKARIEVKVGIPCLTGELTWAKNVPLFVSGTLAGLRIGPICGNFEGVMAGAERISWLVEDTTAGQEFDW